jgi:peptide-methionine (S)-S-oxide reductase
MTASYRSAMFYLDDSQKRIAYNIIADIDASRLWPAADVTEVTPASDFWEAEPEHYLVHNPSGYTCHYVRPEWKLGSCSRSRGIEHLTVEASRHG